MTSRPRYLGHGLVAGLIGATIVAVWFLILDAARGRPLRTPALLGAAALSGVNDPAVVPTSVGLVAQYTVLHGVVFALIGVLIGYLIVSAQSRPSGPLVLAIGLLCLEVAFLAVLTLLARPVLTEVHWWAILLANALALAGMLAYLLMAQRALARALLGPWTRVASEGLGAGLVGATAVAVWFLVHDAAAGTLFRTPALLGAVLFHGLHDPAALEITAPLVLQYTVVHGVAFVAFGWVVAALLGWADREPRFLFVPVMLFCCFEVFFVAMVAVLAGWLLDTIEWWTILLANLFATLAMLGYFFRGHRVAWRQFLAERQ